MKHLMWNEAFNVEFANDNVDFVFPDTCCTVAADKSSADTTWFIKVKRLAMKLKLVKKLMIMVIKLQLVIGYIHGVVLRNFLPKP